MKKNVLILGGSGFIGQHLIAKLVDNGYVVSVAVRSRASADKLRRFAANTIIYDQNDDVKFGDCFIGKDAVINLIDGASTNVLITSVFNGETEFKTIISFLLLMRTDINAASAKAEAPSYIPE